MQTCETADQHDFLAIGRFIFPDYERMTRDSERAGNSARPGLGPRKRHVTIFDALNFSYCRDS
jgi:hypothetical protein